MSQEYIKLWLMLGGVLVFAMGMLYLVLKPRSAARDPRVISKRTAARALYVAQATDPDPTQPGAE